MREKEQPDNTFSSTVVIIIVLIVVVIKVTVEALPHATPKRLQRSRRRRRRHCFGVGHVRVDLALHPDIIDDFPVLVPQRRAVHLVPKRGAVLAVIEQQHAHIDSFRNGFAHFRHFLHVGFGPLNETAIPPEHLGKCTTRTNDEGRQ